MTADQYSSAYAKARRQWPFLTAKAMKAIHAAYAEAGRKIADIIREGELVDGVLSFETQQAVDRAILEGSQAIGEALRNGVPALVYEAAGLYAVIESTFLTEALGDAGKLTAEGVAKLFTKTSESAVLRSINTVGADGHIFWGRVPNIAKKSGPDIVNFTRAGISEGRDLGKLAQDITTYTQKGKIIAARRWGEILKPGTKQFLKRCPETIDYRALRLARTELGRGIEATNLANGLANPGAIDLFDWVRINTIDWNCVCPSNQANGPYTAENYPKDRHPNCECHPRVHLKDGTEFRSELQRWANGEKNEALDKWYSEKYLPVQF